MKSNKDSLEVLESFLTMHQVLSQAGTSLAVFCIGAEIWLHYGVFYNVKV